MMSSVSIVAMIFGLSLCVGSTSAAVAQQPGGEGDYETLRNRLGLLRYCRDKGLINGATSDRAITKVQSELRLTRAPTDKGRGDAAEKAGHSGLFGSTRRDVVTFATAMGTTPAELCKGWSEE
jgi:hypothetical protein